MNKEYNKTIGKTIEKIVDVSTENCEALKFVFTDGTFMIIQGVGDNDYDGLFYKFYPVINE